MAALLLVGDRRFCVLDVHTSFDSRDLIIYPQQLFRFSSFFALLMGQSFTKWK
jgi:hypothetical protein